VPRITARQALALGLVHGPAELVPVSSSGHTTLLAWQRHWNFAALDPAARKRFEVALHAGTTAALLLAGRRELAVGHTEQHDVEAGAVGAAPKRALNRSARARKRGHERAPNPPAPDHSDSQGACAPGLVTFRFPDRDTGREMMFVNCDIEVHPDR